MGVLLNQPYSLLLWLSLILPEARDTLKVVMIFVRSAVFSRRLSSGSPTFMFRLVSSLNSRFRASSRVSPSSTCPPMRCQQFLKGSTLRFRSRIFPFLT